MDILGKIVAVKKAEVEKLRPLSSIERFERDGFFWKISTRSLVDTLQFPGSNGIIAEFKRRSPSKGWFKPRDLEVEAVVKNYNQYAAGISILTDSDFFGGDLDDLIQAKVISDIPVLRKDFIIDRWQIAESKAFGADVILLIAACLTKDQVKDFAKYAKSIGLEVLLEIRNEEELDYIIDDVDIVGVNNRNLETFEVDVNTSFSLIRKLPPDKPAVAESGLGDVSIINRLRESGFRGFLIGEAFMKLDNPGEGFEKFAKEINNSKQ